MSIVRGKERKERWRNGGVAKLETKRKCLSRRVLWLERDGRVGSRSAWQDGGGGDSSK